MQLGLKIKQRRTMLLLTQEELANRCELTKGYISQLENDKVSPSIETLEVILEVLGTNFSEFFREKVEEKIVYNDEDHYQKEFDGYIQKWLVPSSQEKMMEPILLKIEPNCTTLEDYPHPGEEFGYVIKGTIKVVHGDVIKRCKTGDAFYLKANETHYLVNDSSKPAEIIWVSTPPNF